MFLLFGSKFLALTLLDFCVNYPHCRNQKYTLCFHHLEGLLVCSEPVLNGVHARRDCVHNPLTRGCVSGHFQALLVRFLDDHAHFVNCQSRVGPVGVNFYQIGAVTDLLADGAAGVLHTTYHLGAIGNP